MARRGRAPHQLTTHTLQCFRWRLSELRMRPDTCLGSVLRCQNPSALAWMQQHFVSSGGKLWPLCWTKRVRFNSVLSTRHGQFVWLSRNRPIRGKPSSPHVGHRLPRFGRLSPRSFLIATRSRISTKIQRHGVRVAARSLRLLASGSAYPSR